jgi:ABC-2 type transport system permease protein
MEEVKSAVEVVYILWLRQLKRYRRSPARIIGSIGQPLLFLVALGFGFGPIYTRAGGGDYIQFLAPGVIALGILFTGVFSGIEIIWDRQFGFLKETLVAPISRAQIVVGRTLGGTTVALLQGVIVFLITLPIGFRPRLLFLPVAAGFAFLTALFFTALGTAVASVVEDMQAFPLIMNFLVMPLFFLSGALFPLDGLPSGMLAAARVDPLAYGVDGLRGALLGQSHFGLLTDAALLSLLTGLALLLGGFLFSRIEV